MESNYLYCYRENIGTTDDNMKLPYRNRILAFPRGGQVNPLGERVYRSLRDLKRNDSLYNSYIASDKSASKITEERFVFYLEGFVETPMDEEFDTQSANILLHTVIGQSKGKDLKGLHLMTEWNDKARVVKVTKQPNRMGVYKAIVEGYSSTKNKWIQKHQISTMFPDSWTAKTLLFEIHSAYANRTKKGNFDNVFEGQTTTGVPVEFVIMKNKVLTVYPIYNKD